MDGQAFPASAMVGARIVIQGDRFSSTGMGATYEGTFGVDATKAPRTIDMKFTSGPEKGNTNFGIYELDQSAWRLCLATRGTERPKKFATQPGSGIALEILRRASSASQKAPAFNAAQLNLANGHFPPAPQLGRGRAMMTGTLD